MLRQQIFSHVPYLKYFIRKKHVFHSALTTLSQLEDYLIKSVHYEDGLVAVNKPVGVSFEKDLVNSDSLNSTKPICIKSALPALKHHLKVKELFNIKIPERNISGVTLFADNENLAKEVQKWFKVMRERKEPSDTYHALVIGKPQLHSGFFDGTISLQTKNGVKRVVLSEKIGRNAVKRGEAKRVTIEHNTLASTGEVSLLQVKASRVKWNCIRAYLATQTLTPVLGDSLYGCYVKQLLGSPVPVDIFNKTQLPKHKMPEDIINKLKMDGRREVTVPLHLHVSTVRLMKEKRLMIEIDMPYPSVFKWSLEQLGLIQDQSQSLKASSLSA